MVEKKICGTIMYCGDHMTYILIGLPMNSGRCKDFCEEEPYERSGTFHDILWNLCADSCEEKSMGNLWTSTGIPSGLCGGLKEILRLPVRSSELCEQQLMTSIFQIKMTSLCSLMWIPLWIGNQWKNLRLLMRYSGQCGGPPGEEVHGKFRNCVKIFGWGGPMVSPEIFHEIL